MTQERPIAKRQQAIKNVSNYRERRKEAGLKEIRNLWIRPEDEQRVRKYVSKLITAGGIKSDL